jgi:hypothetical protein
LAANPFPEFTGTSPLDAPQFVAKWRQVELTERSACQQHFLDPAEAEEEIEEDDEA